MLRPYFNNEITYISCHSGASAREKTRAFFCICVARTFRWVPLKHIRCRTVVFPTEDCPVRAISVRWLPREPEQNYMWHSSACDLAGRLSAPLRFVQVLQIRSTVFATSSQYRSIFPNVCAGASPKFVHPLQVPDSHHIPAHIISCFSVVPCLSLHPPTFVEGVTLLGGYLAPPTPDTGKKEGDEVP